MVTTALKMALWRRDHANRHVGARLIDHSDARAGPSVKSLQESQHNPTSRRCPWERLG